MLGQMVISSCVFYSQRRGRVGGGGVGRMQTKENARGRSVIFQNLLLEELYLLIFSKLGVASSLCQMILQTKPKNLFLPLTLNI